MKKRIPRSQRPLTIIVIIVALVAAGAFAYLRFFAPPERQDFEQAKAQAVELKMATQQADQVTAKHVQAVVASLRLDPTGKKLEDDTAQTRADYDRALDRYSRTLDELNKSPAVRDEQVGKAIEKVTAQSATFTKSFAALTDMYPTFYKTYISCDDVNRFAPVADPATSAKNFNAASDDCLRDLSQLARSSKVKTIAEYATDYERVVREQRSAYEDLTKPGVDKVALTKRLADSNSKTTMLDPVSKLQDERTKAIDTTAIDELVKQLDAKIKALK